MKRKVTLGIVLFIAGIVLLFYSFINHVTDYIQTHESRSLHNAQTIDDNIKERIDECKESLVFLENYDVFARIQKRWIEEGDEQGIKEYLENSENSEETTALITDGAYASEETSKLAANKNMGLLTTGLLGRKPKEILGQFDVDESGHKVTNCPIGNSPKSSSYIKQTDSIRVSFYKHQCE